ncbi:MAG: tRNA pseudouridine(54/55) synthase Pus10 [Candidatus Bathyarchaeota archaeon]
MEDILDTAKELLENCCLCDSCLGRQFANLASGTSNAERGSALKMALILKAHSMIVEDKRGGKKLLKDIALNSLSDVAIETLKKASLEVKIENRTCEICKGKLQQLRKIASKIMRKIRDYEFNSFLVGAKIPEAIIEAEDSLRARYRIQWGETIRSEFTREMGKIIANKTLKPADYRKPDLTIKISPYDEEITLQIAPLLISGHYRKFVAGISQSKWLCRNCGGKGCQVCGGTGKRYSDSVQEIVATPILKLTGGEDTTFHAGDTEDIDAKVLGNGKPFIIEVKKPRKRNINLATIKKQVNTSKKVEVEDLHFAAGDHIKKIKMAESAEKIYQVIIEVGEGITEKDIANLQKTLSACQVKQETTKRAIHRRVNRVQERYIYETKIRKMTPKKIEMTIRCQGGLHLKELISGDNGRTDPSVAKILLKNVKCIEMNVLGIQRENSS